MRFQGLLYRALNPIYAFEPLSGEGARRYGGRFNAKGVSALYTSLSPETAIKEANQVGSLQPTTLVSYEADINPVFDCRDVAALKLNSVTMEELSADTWRDEMIRNSKSKTQRFAETLVKDGFAGMITPSFVRGAQSSDVNLILWSWNVDESSLLRLIDDEQRLAPPNAN